MRSEPTWIERRSFGPGLTWAQKALYLLPVAGVPALILRIGWVCWQSALVALVTSSVACTTLLLPSVLLLRTIAGVAASLCIVLVWCSAAYFATFNIFAASPPQVDWCHSRYVQTSITAAPTALLPHRVGRTPSGRPILSSGCKSVTLLVEASRGPIVVYDLAYDG